MMDESYSIELDDSKKKGNINIKILKCILIASIFLLVIVSGLCFAFYYEFNRLNNPIMTGVELIKMVILNKEYKIINENPKTIIARCDNALNILEKYMNMQGYKYVEKRGSYIVFENDLNEKQTFSFRINKYYSIWEWRY